MLESTPMSDLTNVMSVAEPSMKVPVLKDIPESMQKKGPIFIFVMYVEKLSMNLII